jgi:metal-responsive CopG/Arc/MetJ family transcriptional regulator
MIAQKNKFDTRYYSGYTGNMKTAISIPDNLFRKVDQYAKCHGFSRSELFAKAIEHYLEIHPSDHITKQLNEVYSSKQAELNEMLSTIQFSSIEKEEW